MNSDLLDNLQRLYKLTHPYYTEINCLYALVSTSLVCAIVVVGARIDLSGSLKSCDKGCKTLIMLLIALIVSVPLVITVQETVRQSVPGEVRAEYSRIVNSIHAQVDKQIHATVIGSPDDFAWSALSARNNGLSRGVAFIRDGQSDTSHGTLIYNFVNQSFSLVEHKQY